MKPFRTGPLFELTWRARVECRRGDMIVSRPVETSALNQDQARERMFAIMHTIWPGWVVRFISQPEVLR